MPRKIESHDTWQLCKTGIHGLKKLLLTISMNLGQKKIQAMTSHQHQNVDMDKVAEEEECINIKQTTHPEESDLKLYHNALYHPINLKLYLQDNRLKMCHNALYYPINLKLKHHPQHRNQHPSFMSSPLECIMFLWQLDKVATVLMPLVGMPNGPLVPQNDEDRLLCGRQPTIVMYNYMIQKCYTCDVRYDPNFMCPPHNMVIRSITRRSRIINGCKI